jgi:hypothetical protein
VHDRRRFFQRSALAAGALLLPQLRQPHQLIAQGLAAAASPGSLHVLDRPYLIEVHINPEMRVKVARGPARATLVERSWRPFLVKVRNEAGTTAPLRATSRAQRWLDLEMFDDPLLSPTLSGLELEYRIVRLYSREAGQREASLSFDVGQGSQDLGFRNEVPILFDCQAAWRG